MRVRLTPAAEFEITDAVTWYEMQAPGLGERFLGEFSSLTKRLGENPQQYAAIYKNTHRAPFHRFPYGLFFRIGKNDVEVFACLHFSRNPLQWRRRS